MPTDFQSVFPGRFPIIGMIHLTGEYGYAIRQRAVDEVKLLADAGVDAALIENYECKDLDILRSATHAIVNAQNRPQVLGVNILGRDDFARSFPLAREFGLQFVQLDAIAEVYANGPSPEYFRRLELGLQRYPELVVLGGVHPKYYTPLRPEDLGEDLATARRRASAVVVTGTGTGSETPLPKIECFRRILGGHPLIVGAGLIAENVRAQFEHADGGIVGSAFKPHGLTQSPMAEVYVTQFMREVGAIRRG